MSILENPEFKAFIKDRAKAKEDKKVLFGHVEGCIDGAEKAEEILTKQFEEELKNYISLNDMFAFQEWLDKKANSPDEMTFCFIDKEYPELYQLYFKEKENKK